MGSCPIWNLSGGKLSAREFVHRGTCPGGSCQGGTCLAGQGPLFALTVNWSEHGFINFWMSLLMFMISESAEANNGKNMVFQLYLSEL